MTLPQQEEPLQRGAAQSEFVLQEGESTKFHNLESALHVLFSKIGDPHKDAPEWGAVWEAIRLCSPIGKLATLPAGESPAAAPAAPLPQEPHLSPVEKSALDTTTNEV